MRYLRRICSLVLSSLALGACGAPPAAEVQTPARFSGGESVQSNPPARDSVTAGHDWTRFGWDASRSSAATAPTGITAGNVAALRRQQVVLDGTVDASAIYLHGVRANGATRDVFFVTTTYGKTLAIDANDGRSSGGLHHPDTTRGRDHAASRPRHRLQIPIERSSTPLHRTATYRRSPSRTAARSGARRSRSCLSARRLPHLSTMTAAE